MGRHFTQVRKRVVLCFIERHHNAGFIQWRHHHSNKINQIDSYLVDRLWGITMAELTESYTNPSGNVIVPISTESIILNSTGSNNVSPNVGLIIALCTINRCIFRYRDTTIIRLKLMTNFDIHEIPIRAFVGAPYLNVSDHWPFHSMW